MLLLHNLYQIISILSSYLVGFPDQFSKWFSLPQCGIHHQFSTLPKMYLAISLNVYSFYLIKIN